MSASIVAGDTLTLAFIFGLTAIVRHLVTPSYQLTAHLEMAPFVVLIIAAFGMQGLYPGVLLHPAEEMRRIFFSVTATFLLVAATSFLWRNAEAFSRSVFLITWAGGAPLVLLTRYALRRAFGSRPWWGVPAIIFGSDAIAQRVARKLDSGMLGIRVAGFLSDERAQLWPKDLPPILGDLSAASQLAKTGVAQYAIIAMQHDPRSDLRTVLQDYCRGFCHVLLVPDMPGLCSLGVSARELGGEVGFELPQRLFHTRTAALKRVLDVLLASSALLVTLPAFLVVAAAVKASSLGPIFYGQTRQGKGGGNFRALKFRTMVEGADQILATYLEEHPEHLLEWRRDHKLKSDPRVTKVGKFLRRLSLDELPQLFNVIAGQMSLVGPRPIVKAEVEKYGRGYQSYTRVRPGITGLWQVSGRNNTTYEERVAFDEYYVRNWSIWLDLYILIRTLRVVLTAEGAY